MYLVLVCGATGTLIHCQWECKEHNYFGKQFRRFLQGQKYLYQIILQLHSVLFTQEKLRHMPCKYLFVEFFRDFFHIGKNLEKTQSSSIGEQVIRFWYFDGILLSNKDNKLLIHVITWKKFKRCCAKGARQKSTHMIPFI